MPAAHRALRSCLVSRWRLQRFLTFGDYLHWAQFCASCFLYSLLSEQLNASCTLLSIWKNGRQMLIRTFAMASVKACCFWEKKLDKQVKQQCIRRQVFRGLSSLLCILESPKTNLDLTDFHGFYQSFQQTSGIVFEIGKLKVSSTFLKINYSLHLHSVVFSLLLTVSLNKPQKWVNTRVGTLIVATIYLQLIQNRYMFRSLLSFSVVTSIVYNPLPAMWKS